MGQFCLTVAIKRAQFWPWEADTVSDGRSPGLRQITYGGPEDQEQGLRLALQASKGRSLAPIHTRC